MFVRYFSGNKFKENIWFVVAALWFFVEWMLFGSQRMILLTDNLLETLLELCLIRPDFCCLDERQLQRLHGRELQSVTGGLCSLKMTSVRQHLCSKTRAACWNRSNTHLPPFSHLKGVGVCFCCGTFDIRESGFRTELCWNTRSICTLLFEQWSCYFTNGLIRLNSSLLSQFGSSCLLGRPAAFKFKTQINETFQLPPFFCFHNCRHPLPHIRLPPQSRVSVSATTEAANSNDFHRLRAFVCY